MAIKITKKEIVDNIVNKWLSKKEKTNQSKDKQSFIDGWRSCEEYHTPKKCKNLELDDTWVDYKKQSPTDNGYYLTKVGNGMIVDYWDGKHFTFNNQLLTHWQIKDN